MVLTVSNHGPAIPAHLWERILEPFVQADSSPTRSADGVGLGLHIVQRIAARRSGRVSVDCWDGRTTFTVWLPAPEGTHLLETTGAPAGAT